MSVYFTTCLYTQFKKVGTKLIDVSSTEEQCTPLWTVFLKKKDQMFDEQAYIEVNMTANIKVTVLF